MMTTDTDFRTQVQSAMEALGGRHAVRHMTAVDRDTRKAVAGSTPPSIRTTDCRATYDPIRGISRLHVDLEIALPLAKLAPFLDPQGWSRFSPSFAASYRVDPTTYERIDAPPPGTSWSGYLFEDFRVPIGRFRNILKVRFEAAPARIWARYDLHHALQFDFVAWSAPGGVEIDLGEVTAEAHGVDASRVTITKTLAFRDLTPRDPGRHVDHGRWLAYLAPAMMTLHAAETSGFGPLVVDD
jgi:hypothetical protein